MIILDTNVASSLISQEPDQTVLEWINGYDISRIYTTTVTVMEIQYGIDLMVDGKRKRRLLKAFQKMLSEVFDSRLLDLNVKAALSAAGLFAALRQKGNNVEIRDIQIAGIVKANGGILATRNVKDFKDCGIKLLNPWQ